MKTKKKRVKYDELRKEILIEDNKKEDKLIKTLSKRLKINTRKKGKSKYPLWLRQCGYDYLLNFEEELNLPEPEAAPVDLIGELPKKKKKKVDLYGQKTDQNAQTDLSGDIDFDGNVEVFEESSDLAPVREEALPAHPESAQLRRAIRSWLNRLSEPSMPRVIAEITNIFRDNPKAIVRCILLDEVCLLLESSPVSTRSNIGWLQQELAVCLACVHVSLHAKLQHDNLIGFLCEAMVEKLIQPTDNVKSTDTLCSFAIFLCYLYRFGVVSHILIFDVIKELLKKTDGYQFRVVHSMCLAVGVHLRKQDLASSQEIIRITTEKLTECNADQVESICDLEGVIGRLSEKHSREECVSRALHLKKMMSIWSKVPSVSRDVCLSVRLQDLLTGASRGRWWVVGSAANPVTDTDSSNKMEVKPGLSLELESAAARLGLKTPARQNLFAVLISTPGGPDATASALLKSCIAEAGSNAPTGRNTLKEREMIQIVMQCLMAEEPFNRFYPRVLGGFLNHHRRFVMMIKCVFWDVLKKPELSVNAKANAGRALGLLSSVYDLPLTILKNFNFGDATDGNTAFLRNVFAELCNLDHQKALGKLMQLSCYTRLSRNCRIFMRKHFAHETDATLRASVLRLASDMRESETF